MQCAEYFPEGLDETSVYKGGWRITCTALAEVDSDVRQRRLSVTPPFPDMGMPPSRLK